MSNEPDRIMYPPLGVWLRPFGDQWTTAPFRDLIAAWATLFVERHNWSDSWEIFERSGSSAIAVRLPRMPRWQLADKPGEYRQRPGERHVLVRFKRPYLDTRAAEVAIPFEPDGIDTPVETLAILLDVARRAAEAQA